MSCSFCSLRFISNFAIQLTSRVLFLAIILAKIGIFRKFEELYCMTKWLWKRWRETKQNFHKSKFPTWILATISSICKLLWKGFRFYPHRSDLALRCVSCWLHPYSHFLRFDDSIFYPCWTVTKNVFMTAFYAVSPTAVKIAWNNISSGFAAYAAFCGVIKRFHRFIRN